MMKRLLVAALLAVATVAHADSWTLSTQHTRPDTGAPAVVAKGIAITTSGSAAVSAIPLASNGDPANRVRVSATAAAYVKIGAGGANTGATVVDSAAGTGYHAGDSINLAGGTFSTPMKLSVATTKLISTASVAPGTGYNIGDTVTLAGGTAGTKAILTLSTTKLVSVAINAGGSGYAVNDTVTLSGGTASAKAILTVDTVSGGAIQTFHISTAGSYTVEATTFTQFATSGIGTGATFQTGAFGVLTYSVSTPGSYTVEPTVFTQDSTTGSGTGATFGTTVFGVNTAAVTDGGAYSSLPSNPVSQASSSGSGASATFTVTWLTAAAAGDLLVQPGDALIIDSVGMDVISAIQVTGAGVVQVSPLEN